MTMVSLHHTLIALILAALLVALPDGLMLMLIPWLVVVVLACRREHERGRATATFATYVTIMLLVVVAASAAPVKTTETFLDRQVMLPRAKMTLAEMDREIDFENASWLPRYVHVTTSPGSASQEIRFPQTDITLREFVRSIESQSSLQHRFAHCGNGSSILFGGDCCFGLYLQEERD